MSEGREGGDGRGGEKGRQFLEKRKEGGWK